MGVFFILFFQDDNDVYILIKVLDILYLIFSSYKEKVLSWFEQLFLLIVNLIVSVNFFDSCFRQFIWSFFIVVFENLDL